MAAADRSRAGKVAPLEETCFVSDRPGGTRTLVDECYEARKFSLSACSASG
jgi:hypothetical protein